MKIIKSSSIKNKEVRLILEREASPSPEIHETVIKILQDVRSGGVKTVTEYAKKFDEEKKKLISYIEKVRDRGNSNFEGKKSHSFDPLTVKEWYVLFTKHMEHHLTQFGV